MPRTTAASLVLALLFASTLLACGGKSIRPTGPVEPKLTADRLGSVRSALTYDGDWMGGVPLPEDLDDDLDLARRRGVATIIDLRDDRARTELPLEQAAVRVGMDLVVVERNLPGESIQDLTSEISNAAIDSVRDVLNRPGRDGVLLLDDDGSLSAAVYAIHLAADKGADPSDVLRGARGSGLSERDADFVRSQLARIGG
ncbi:MAG: hypothetical protein AAGB93_09585 [Planctomycetota bacterium]